jgi:hypothetical protein
MRQKLIDQADDVAVRVRHALHPLQPPSLQPAQYLRLVNYTLLKQ